MEVEVRTQYNGSLEMASEGRRLVLSGVEMDEKEGRN